MYDYVRKMMALLFLPAEKIENTIQSPPATSDNRGLENLLPIRQWQLDYQPLSWYCVTLSLHVALHMHPIYQPIQCNLVWLYNNRQHLAERDRPTRCDTEVVASTEIDIKNLFLFIESWQPYLPTSNLEHVHGSRQNQQWPGGVAQRPQQTSEGKSSVAPQHLFPFKSDSCPTEDWEGISVRLIKSIRRQSSAYGKPMKTVRKTQNSCWRHALI